MKNLHPLSFWGLSTSNVGNKYGWLSKCINTRFVCSSTTVYKLCRYAKLPNKASAINPMTDYFLTALKIHIDDVYIVNILHSGFMKH